MASLDDLIDELEALSDRLDEAAAEAINHGAFVFKQQLQAGIARAVGSDMEFSEGGPIPVSVRYRLTGSGQVHTARIYPIGPVWWLRGTRPHDIAPKRRKAVKFPDGQVRSGGVRHPGTRNRSTWERDKDRAAPEAAKAMAGHFAELVRKG